MTRIKRAMLWLQLFALEIHIEGQTKTLGWLNEIDGDPITRSNIEQAQRNARAERARLRAEYNATFRVGQRRTWRTA